MKFINNDKIIESKRYDDRAISLLENKSGEELDVASMHPVLMEPYLKYYDLLKKCSKNSSIILELGCGFGTHSEILLKNYKNVTLSDISENSLRFVKKRFSEKYKNFTTSVADIEKLPFSNNSFDVVCCAGSLSYGNIDLIKKEILRILKSEGYFICVDSLNHNPIYKLNRLIGFLRRKRTWSTIKNMPNIHKINFLQDGFITESISYYGVIAWTIKIFKYFIIERHMIFINRYFDKLDFLKLLSFKFVMKIKKK